MSVIKDFQASKLNVVYLGSVEHAFSSKVWKLIELPAIGAPDQNILREKQFCSNFTQRLPKS